MLFSIGGASTLKTEAGNSIAKAVVTESLHGSAGEGIALPSVPKIFTKKNVGEDIQVKIRQLQEICYSKGMTETEAHHTLALVDHESAGTYSTTIKGDKGCSIGIGQWNKCVGRIAGKDFEAQSHQICDEMKSKYNVWELYTAITKHNCPACMHRAVYVNKVKASLKNFN